MADKTQVERRAGERVGCNVTVQVHAPSEDVLLFTYATNLSETGVYVRANRSLPVGTEVDLELQPHNLGDRIAMRGRVVRVNEQANKEPRGMGLVFIDLGPDESSSIKRLVDRIGDRSLITVGDPDTYSKQRGRFRQPPRQPTFRPALATSLDPS